MTTKSEQEQLKVPFMCENYEEFVKSLFIISHSIPTLVSCGKVEPLEAAAMYVDMFKMMAHDYHALVSTGKMEAYQFGNKNMNDPEYKEMREIFENGMKECTMGLAMCGVPVKEGENGTLKIDFMKMEENEKNE